MTFSPALPALLHPPLSRRSSSSDGRLRVSAADLAAAIAAAGPRASLPAIVMAHAVASARLALRGVRYLVQGSQVEEVYRRMTTDDFQCINARQAWANWRTIPRNLHGNLPVDRPLAVLDLCCGTGDSLRTLAWWLPRGSHLVGMEADARFAAYASTMSYRNRTDDPIAVTVHQASVLDGFRDHHGGRCADQAFDVVHAIGSIGCHFTPAQAETIVGECARVLAPGGFALLDAGRPGTPAATLSALAIRHGLQVTGRSRSWWFDRYEQLVLRRVA